MSAYAAVSSAQSSAPPRRPPLISLMRGAAPNQTHLSGCWWGRPVSSLAGFAVVVVARGTRGSGAVRVRRGGGRPDGSRARHRTCCFPVVGPPLCVHLVPLLPARRLVKGASPSATTATTDGSEGSASAQL